MTEINIILTSVVTIYAMIVHISLIRLKIQVLKLLDAIKENHGVVPVKVMDWIINEMSKKG